MIGHFCGNITGLKPSPKSHLHVFKLQCLFVEVTTSHNPKMDLEEESLDDHPGSPLSENPMAYLGLRRRNAGETDSDATPVKKDPGKRR